jgi:hypothetical protein
LHGDATVEEPELAVADVVVVDVLAGDVHDKQ